MNKKNITLQFFPEPDKSDILKIISTSKIESNLNQMEGAVAYKTADHEIIHCNKKYLECAGYKNVKKITGKTDCDLVWQQYSDIYHQQENDILKGKTYAALYPGKRADESNTIYLSKKYPWVNEDGFVIGIISYGLELQSTSADLKFLFDQSIISPGTGFPIQDSIDFSQSIENPYKLTNRQLDCLFYLVKGMTIKEIAKTLDLSPKTVEHYLDAIKIKLGCNSRSTLITKALTLRSIKKRLILST